VGFTAGVTSPGSTSYPTSTFGRGVGATTVQAVTGYVRASKFTLAVPGTVKKVSVYISSGATGNLRVGIYKNDGSGGAPGTLVTESAAATAANDWNDISVTPAYIPAGTYYLAFQNSVTGPIFTYDTVPTGDFYKISWTFGSFPNPFGTGEAGTSSYSQQATYVQIKGYIKGTKVIPGWSGGKVIDKVYFYAHNTGNVRLAVYNNASPKNKLWESSSIAVTAGWNSVNISSGTPTSLSLTGGSTYWLCWQTDSVNDVPSYVAGASGDGFYLAYTYGAYPSTISGETSSAEKWAMYVETADPSFSEAPTTLSDFRKMEIGKYLVE